MLDPIKAFDAKEFANRMIAGFARVNNNQATGHLVQRKRNDEGIELEKPGSACALGAVALGYGLTVKQIEQASETNHYWWPANTEKPQAECPYRSIRMATQCAEYAPGEYSGSLEKVIPHLNDEHQWSVPDIAAWLTDRNHRPEDGAENDDEYMDDSDAEVSW
jgi:hypothetical protein